MEKYTIKSGDDSENDCNPQGGTPSQSSAMFHFNNGQVNFLMEGLKQNYKYEVFKNMGHVQKNERLKNRNKDDKNDAVLTVADIYDQEQYKGKQTKAIQNIMEAPKKVKQEVTESHSLFEERYSRVLLEYEQDKSEHNRQSTVQYELFKLMTANVGAYLQKIYREDQASQLPDEKIGVVELAAIKGQTFAICTVLKAVDSHASERHSCDRSDLIHYETWLKLFKVEEVQLEKELYELPQLGEEWKEELERAKSQFDLKVSYGKLKSLQTEEFFISSQDCHTENSCESEDQDLPLNDYTNYVQKLSYKIEDTRIFFFKINKAERSFDHNHSGSKVAWDLVLSEINLESQQFREINTFTMHYDPEYIPVRVVFVEIEIDMVRDESFTKQSLSRVIVFICLKKANSDGFIQGYLHMVEITENELYERKSFKELPICFPINDVKVQEFDSIDNIDKAQKERFDGDIKHKFLVLYNIDRDPNDELISQFTLLKVPMRKTRINGEIEIVQQVNDYVKINGYNELYDFLGDIGFNQTRTAVYDRIKTHQVNYPVLRNLSEYQFLNSISRLTNQQGDQLEMSHLNTSTLLNTFSDTLSIVAHGVHQQIGDILVLQMKLNRYITSWNISQELAQYSLNQSLFNQFMDNPKTTIPQTFKIDRSDPSNIETDNNIQIGKTERQNQSSTMLKKATINPFALKVTKKKEVRQLNVEYKFVSHLNSKKSVNTEKYTEIKIIKDGSTRTKEAAKFEFPDKIVRHYLKPQNVNDLDDDREELVCVFFNYDVHFTDIILAVLKEEDLKASMPCFNHEQTHSCLYPHYNQKLNCIHLTFSSEISQGKYNQTCFFWQNYQIALLDIRNYLIHIEEKQIRWIPSNSGFDIEIHKIGVKSIVIEQLGKQSGIELMDLRFCPYFELMDTQDGNYVNQVMGSEVFIKIKVHMSGQFRGIADFVPIREDKKMNEWYHEHIVDTKKEAKSNWLDLLQKKPKITNLLDDLSLDQERDHTGLIIPIIFRDLSIKERTIYDNKFTRTRVMEMNQGLNALIAESWINQELFQFITSENIIGDYVINNILDTVNRRALNSKLLDIDEFMKSADNQKIFNKLSQLQKITPSTFPKISNYDLFEYDLRKIFLCHQIKNGSSLVDFIKDSGSIELVFKFIREAEITNSLGFNYIKNEVEPYQLTTLERILQGDTESRRYNLLVSQDIVLDQNIIQLNMNYLSPIVLKLVGMQKNSAEILLEYFQKNQTINQSKINQFESILSYYIESSLSLPSFDNFFKNPFEAYDQNQLRISLFMPQSQLEALNMSEYVDQPLTMLKIYQVGMTRRNIFRRMAKEFNSLLTMNEANVYIQYVYFPFGIIRDATFLNKIQLMKQNITEDIIQETASELESDDFHLAEMIVKICEKVNDLSQDTFIKNIIDVQFKKTLNFLLFNAFIYIGLYLIPTFTIILVPQDQQETQTYMNTKTALLVLSLIGQTYSFIIEIFQLFQSGILEYFESPLNWFDVSNYFFFMAFLFVQWDHDQWHLESIPNINGISAHPHYSSYNQTSGKWVPQAVNATTSAKAKKQMDYTIILVLLIVTTLFKCTKYLVLIKGMSDLEDLLVACCQQIVYMVLFTFFMTVSFTIIMMVLGVGYDEDTDSTAFDHNHQMYPYVAQFTATFIQNYRNALGDVATPHYYYWERIMVEHKELRNETGIMICIVWMIWGLQTFFSVVIIMNFLIALVNNSYESASSVQEMTLYSEMANHNFEFFQIMSCLPKTLSQLFGYDPEPYRIILLASEKPAFKDDELSHISKAKAEIIDKLSKKVNIVSTHLDLKITQTHAKLVRQIESLRKQQEINIKQSLEMQTSKLLVHLAKEMKPRESPIQLVESSPRSSPEFDQDFPEQISDEIAVKLGLDRAQPFSMENLKFKKESTKQMIMQQLEESLTEKNIDDEGLQVQKTVQARMMDNK